jgi:hypothetical protein
MNNPFINLRKFVRDRADPKENHATESLAACLQFSPVLRKEFVRFLFGDTPLPFNNDDCTALEVSSQENVGKFGILDLGIIRGQSTNLDRTVAATLDPVGFIRQQ